VSGVLSNRILTRRRLACTGAVIIVVWLLAFVGAKWLIVRVSTQHADAIVVLSGSATMSERISLAVRLLKEGKSARVILTNDNLVGGWSNTHQRNLLSFERASLLLSEAGIAESTITVIPQAVAGTYDEAVVVRKFSEENQLQSLLLITSGYHSRRTYSAFTREFEGSPIKLSIEPVSPGLQTPHPAIWWLYPRGWVLVPLEYIKLVTYRLKY
jgi:uncharacterized SAM-binding protein YcdF (DUF218 family)